MASAPLLPSSSSASWRKYDVFLSFRGIDVRMGIVSELYHELTKRGIETFEDTNLQPGDVASAALLPAIEESGFAIVILSPNYASSTWCLQEIAYICRSMKYDRILPLFFNVEPHDVSLLKGSFGEAFTNYENSGLYTSEKLQEWKYALKTVANYAGYSNKYKTERELINKIVEDIYSKIQPIENMGDLEATRAPKNTAYVIHIHINVFGGNVNLGRQGDVVNNVDGDLIKDVGGNFNKGTPNSG